MVREGSLRGGIGNAARSRRCFIAVLFLFAMVPAFAFSYQERLILAVEEGRCSLRLEADDDSRTLRLRVHPSTPECATTKEAVQSILKTAFSQPSTPKTEEVYTALSLGRLIDYPWLSQYLANTAYKDNRWDRAKGKPRTLDVYRYVKAILASPEVTSQFEEALGESGYRIVSVTIEKVLVGSFRDMPSWQGEAREGKVPFDCVVWFGLQKK